MKIDNWEVTWRMSFQLSFQGLRLTDDLFKDVGFKSNSRHPSPNDVHDYGKSRVNMPFYFKNIIRLSFCKYIKNLIQYLTETLNFSKHFKIHVLRSNLVSKSSAMHVLR